MTTTCPICQRPSSDWPMAHRGNRACSQACEVLLEERETPHLNFGTVDAAHPLLEGRLREDWSA